MQRHIGKNEISTMAITHEAPLTCCRRAPLIQDEEGRAPHIAWSAHEVGGWGAPILVEFAELHERVVRALLRLWYPGVAGMMARVGRAQVVDDGDVQQLTRLDHPRVQVRHQQHGQMHVRLHPGEAVLHLPASHPSWSCCTEFPARPAPAAIAKRS